MASSAERKSGFDTISISADARAVEIDVRQRRVAVVQAFAGVLFEMQPLDANGDRLASLKIDDHLALAHDRRFVLADLIALRQIGIKIILAVEYRFQIDLGLKA